MFDILKDLTKSAINIAVTPVTIVADIVTFIPDAAEGGEVFSRTGRRIDEAGKNLENAINSEEK